MQDAGGAPGVARDLLDGLAARGHRIDCFFPGTAQKLPAQLAAHDNLTFIWGTSEGHSRRWYSRTKLGTFATGLISRGLASVRLRRAITLRHDKDPYDLIYQNQSIESLGVPPKVTRTGVPLVLRPDTEMVGELKSMLAEWRLGLRCQPAHTFLAVGSIMLVRSLVQRVMIRRADLLVCISDVFRGHLVRNFHYPVERTIVIPNPVSLDRFSGIDRPPGTPPIVLVPTRISVRKGLEDVVAAAAILRDRGEEVRFRLIGGPSLWSDYTKLLDDLPSENAEYAGRVPHAEISAEYARSDLLLMASKYEPFGQTVAEALAGGVPVVATSEVGAIEGIDRSVVAEVAPGDVEAIADAVVAMLAKLHERPSELRAMAHAEARRRFASELVCEQLSDALERLVHGSPVEQHPGPEPALAERGR